MPEISFIDDEFNYQVEYTKTIIQDIKPHINLVELQTYIEENVPDTTFSESNVKLEVLQEPLYGSANFDTFEFSYESNSQEICPIVDDVCIGSLMYDDILLETFIITLDIIENNDNIPKHISLYSLTNTTRSIQLIETSNLYRYVYRILNTTNDTQVTTYETPYYNAYILNDYNLTIETIHEYNGPLQLFVYKVPLSEYPTLDIDSLSDYEFQTQCFEINTIASFTFDEHVYSDYIDKNKMQCSNKFLVSANSVLHIMLQHTFSLVDPYQSTGEYMEYFDHINALIHQSCISYKFNQQIKQFKHFVQSLYQHINITMPE